MDGKPTVGKSLVVLEYIDMNDLNPDLTYKVKTIFEEEFEVIFVVVVVVGKNKSIN